MSHCAEVVGILGGSFDPVHSGHLWVAAEARRLLGLSRVLLVPVAVPAHKPADRLSPAAERRAMLQLAVRDHEDLEISPVELERPGVSYTIDTLRRMREGSPALAPVFLLGMDSLESLTTWRSWRELIAEFDLAVIDRAPGDDETGGEIDPEIAARVVTLDGNASPARVGRGGRIFRLPVPPIAVSSSQIRARARAGDDLSGLVPPAVARYIHDMGLYRQEESR